MRDITTYNIANLNKRAEDCCSDEPLAKKVFGVKLPTKIEAFVTSKGSGWMRNILYLAAIAEMEAESKNSELVEAVDSENLFDQSFYQDFSNFKGYE